MANNRLFIRRKGSKKVMLVAKSFGCWEWYAEPEDMDFFLSIRDLHSAIEGGSTELELIAECDIPEDAIYLKRVSELRDGLNEPPLQPTERRWFDQIFFWRKRAYKP